jgi:hypothetical protein
MRIGPRLILAVLAVMLFLGGVASSASARRQCELRYPFERIWNTALRMVRVDMRMTVTERDADAGFLLFDYVDHGKRYPGSIELLRGDGGRAPATKVVVQVQGMPTYVEQMLLDKLTAKLRAELGDPVVPSEPVPPRKPDPAPEPKPEEPVVAP